MSKIQDILARCAADSPDARERHYWESRPPIGTRFYIPRKPRHHISDRHEYGGRFGTVTGHCDLFDSLVYVTLDATTKSRTRDVTVSWKWTQMVEDEQTHAQAAWRAGSGKNGGAVQELLT